MGTPHQIEKARSGRSACRGCGQKILKDELRLGIGHAQENGSYSHRWWHLGCAVAEHFLELEEALLDTPQQVPDRAILEQRLATAKQLAPVRTTPWAGGPGLDTFLCAACGNWSFPNTVRVFVPAQISVGGQTLDRHVPVHHSCANAHLGQPQLLQTVLANSGPLDPDTVTWLSDGLT